MTARTRVLAVAAALVTAAAMTGCSSSGGGSDSSSSGSSSAPSSNASSSAPTSGSSSGVSGAITVFAASSLKEAFTTLGRQFQAAHPRTTVGFNFDASSALATDISQGQKADVFASASTKNMDSVTQAGDAVDPKNFVSNTMEIATPPGNPAKIASVADLAKPGVKVALCDPAVPCGATAEQVFTNAKVKVKATANEQDVKSTLAIVETKEVDAGMVYVTDVRAAGAKVTGVKIPTTINATTTYPIAVLKKSADQPLAQAWVDYVLSSAGRKVLLADGFSPP